jgi:hypothetical protein
VYQDDKKEEFDAVEKEFQKIIIKIKLQEQAMEEARKVNGWTHEELRQMKRDFIEKYGHKFN